jgi:hypothetical protein
MTSPSNSAVQNLLPVQAYFNLDGSFNTFIGQGTPFYATANPIQSGLTITNSTLNSSPIGNTSPSTGVFTNIATTTGTIGTQPVGATDIVNLLALQSYVAGISWKQPCAVGTLTNITLSGLQTIDGYTTLAGDRVLVKDQTNAANNGIYLASATAWTRSLDADQWNDFISAISFLEYGTQAGGAWFCTAIPGGTLGVTALNWSQFTTSATYSAGTGLTLTGSVFSITPVGTASTYGSATQTPVFTTNASGQVSSVTNTTITPAVGSITGLGTGVATFLATPTSANLAAAVTDETGSGALVFATSPTLVTPILGTPQSGNFSTGTFTWPTFNQNTTGTASNVTGTVAIANGGTGQTSASAAFDALNPMTTTGDIIYEASPTTAARLGIGSTGQILTVVGGIPAWAAAPAAMVYPGVGIPNSTGSAWGTSYSTTGSGTVVALATSPSFTTPILGTPQSGNFSTGTFTWPTFNQNTTGTASNVTGTVAVANGGTGVTTLTGIAYGNGTSAFTAATAAQVVSVIGSTAVTNATNATNATNVGIVDDTTTATAVYPVWSNGTSGNQALETSSTKLSFNPSTGVLSSTGVSVGATGIAFADGSTQVSHAVPQVTTYTSGSGTYTTPTNAKYLYIKMVGGGGGGECSDSAGGPAAGGTGGTTTFGSSLLTCNGGVGGAYNGTNDGGTATLNSPAVGLAVKGSAGASPGIGSPGGTIYLSGGMGGCSPFGGAGQNQWATNNGQPAATNSGSGGGGAGNATVPAIPGGGGGSGGYVEAYITSPSSTYSYAIGAGGTGASAGTNGFAGGNGASGVIIITAFF